jgi:3-oxoacyl-ACP reductase-like protein
MADDVTVEVVNGARVDAMWRGVTADLEHLDDPMTKALRVALDAAQSSAPRRTGLLAASHRIGPGAGANRVELGNTARYARIVHNGSRYLRARPWLADAVTSSEPQWVAALAQQVQGRVDDRARAT